MLLRPQATHMLSFSSELKKNEKRKLAFGGPGRAGRAHHKKQFFRLNPAEPVALRARTQLRTQARTHARTHARNTNATETEIDFPVGSTPQPPIYIYIYICIYISSQKI